MAKKFDLKKTGMKIVGIGAGAVAANALTKVLPASMDSKIVSGIQIAAGAFIPEVIGKKSELIENVGNGMIAVGAMNLVGDLTSTVSGIFGEPRVMGNEVTEEDY